MRNYKSIIIMVVITVIMLITVSCNLSKALKNTENTIDKRNSQLEQIYKELG